MGKQNRDLRETQKHKWKIKIPTHFQISPRIPNTFEHRTDIPQNSKVFPAEVKNPFLLCRDSYIDGNT